MWGSPISSCTNFCRPRTKVQFHLFHCSISHSQDFKRTTPVVENLQTLKNFQKHTQTHTLQKWKKQCFFAFSFMFAVKFFFKRSAPAIHRLIIFRKVTFLQLQNPSHGFNCKHATLNPPGTTMSWIGDPRCFTGSASCNPRWTPPGGWKLELGWCEKRIINVGSWLFLNAVGCMEDFWCVRYLLIGNIERMDVEVHFLHSEDDGRD